MFHVIKDPVHGSMQFTSTEYNWIKPFIDSPNFQRLRHIKQLGMGDFIFPGAVHTRFNHCLGCCYVGSQIANKIGLSEEERQLVMVAGLLHDIGHGPFSHTFEDMFYQKQIRHEAWTPFFLNDYRTDEFFQRYNQQNPEHPMTEEKFLLIENMIMHKSSKKHLLADIVSSQLDADRLDYLLRDSHFCGVTYGQFDLRWMLHSMVIVSSPQGDRLGVTHKGIGVVEHYLMARRLMMRNIYHNQKKLALEYLLVQLLVTLSESLDTQTAYARLKTKRLGRFLLAVNQFNLTAKAFNDTDKLKQAFLQDNFSNYKELCDYDVFAVIRFLSETDNTHASAQIAKRIQQRQIPKIIRLDQVDLTQAGVLIQEFKTTHKNRFQSWQLDLIKSPHQSYTIEDDPILIVDDLGMIRPLNETSLMINAISDKLEQTAFLCVDQAILDDPLITAFIKTLRESVINENCQAT